jgi:hypothetical protein
MSAPPNYYNQPPIQQQQTNKQPRQDPAMKAMNGSPFESVRSSQLVIFLAFRVYNYFFEMPLPRSLITGRDTRRKETHSALA